MQTNTLLDVRAYEIEVLEIIIGNKRYGLNVAKIREIVSLQGRKITKSPSAPELVLGILMMRGLSIPLLELSPLLGGAGVSKVTGVTRKVAVICELHHQMCSFIADQVVAIHRVPWRSIQSLGYLEQYGPPLTGTIFIDDSPLMLLDLESIVGQVLPRSEVSFYEVPSAPGRMEARGNVKVFMAEDSRPVRLIMKRMLGEAGYTQVHPFRNGRECWSALVDCNGQGVDVVISDIEMPELNGLTMCRLIRENPYMTDIPVVLFSSLIRDEFGDKCRDVGASAWMSKPKMPRLVEVIDAIVLGMGELSPEYLAEGHDGS
jgi:two-component system chemotaxis response regulator CheV